MLAKKKDIVKFVVLKTKNELLQRTMLVYAYILKM